MAKDRIVYTIRNIATTCLLETHDWIQVYRPGKEKGESSSRSRSNFGHPFYSYGIYRKTEGLVDLQLMKYSKNKGDLKVSVNIPNIVNGNATTPKSDISIDDLEHIIHKEIKAICQTTQLPDIKEWKVTKDETNIDIIGKSDDIDELYEVLSRFEIPRYTLDMTYADRGTLYYHTGKKLEGSNSVISIYYKDRELAAKHDSFNHNGEGIKPGESCLRIEIRNSKGPLKTAVKNTKKFNEILQNSSVSETVVSTEFQINTLEKLVEAFGLDRTFLTKEELMEVINNSSLSGTGKAGCIRYIEFENGVGNISKSSYYRYKKILKEMGYSPIYSGKRLDVNLTNINDYVEGEISFRWINSPFNKSWQQK